MISAGILNAVACYVTGANQAKAAAASLRAQHVTEACHAAWNVIDVEARVIEDVLPLPPLTKDSR